MRTVRLVIPKLIPSRNQVDKMHWSARYKLRGEWQWLVKAEVLNQKLRVTRLNRARILIERFGRRKLDEDNFVAGCKQLTDALKHEGFIVDDDPEHVQIDYLQHIDLKGEVRTAVTIAPWVECDTRVAGAA